MNKLILSTCIALGIATALPSAAKTTEVAGVRVQGGAIVDTRVVDPRLDARLDTRVNTRIDIDRRSRGDDDRRRNRDRRDDRGELSVRWKHERWRDSHDDRRHERHHDRHYWAEHRYHAPYRYRPPHGYRVYTWAIGHRLPPPFYARTYRIDYRYYGLPRPPRGHHWVRVDNDVYLVRNRSGTVIDVRFGLFF